MGQREQTVPFELLRSSAERAEAQLSTPTHLNTSSTLNRGLVADPSLSPARSQSLALGQRSHDRLDLCQPGSVLADRGPVDVPAHARVRRRRPLAPRRLGPVPPARRRPVPERDHDRREPAGRRVRRGQGARRRHGGQEPARLLQGRRDRRPQAVQPRPGARSLSLSLSLVLSVPSRVARADPTLAFCSPRAPTLAKKTSSRRSSCGACSSTCTS